MSRPSAAVVRGLRSPRTALGRARRATVGHWRRPPFPPNFLIIGAQKAGTRWLRHNLDRHPDVFAASTEVWYFNHRFERGLDWYRDQFRGWWGESLVGESSPGYMMWRAGPAEMARRIDEQLPGVRLFAVLRDPCERVYSAFVHHMARGRVGPEQDLLEYLERFEPERDPLQLIVGGWYAASLAPFFDRFGTRLQVHLNDDIRADARAVYRASLEHLGADAGFVPLELEKVRFSTEAAAAGAPRSADGDGRRLSEAQRRAVYPHFADDLDRLERMLGRDLSAWRSD